MQISNCFTRDLELWIRYHATFLTLSHWKRLFKWLHQSSLFSILFSKMISWFFGHINAKTAELALEKEEPGTFLIRISHNAFAIHLIEPASRFEQTVDILIDGYFCSSFLVSDL